MKINQNVRHFAAKQALTTPGVASVVNYGLVKLHTRVFLGKADPAHAAEREDHLDGLFEATTDTYTAALKAGFTEAEAREITHIQGNFDFYNHGWTEMMEIPADEIEAHYDRYRDFFSHYDITIADPLGSFAPRGGIPEAPSTPEKLDEPEHPHAKGGFADDVYVEGPDGEVLIGGHDEPQDVDLTDAPGVGSEDVEN
ncbi:DUF6149 family protein [Halococcus saccharolyticus]|uniref:Uncharacterized protein n=1 Tax=Halococcus saccharolyticus DSM 5350 TaxID=1227455 RepID=M0MH65_9EURY|nr:DUF6149 family protein [Halococcus saccharolyticus]EMA44019.1 hypothetical protein C449_10853 [Halococcus saccharolyticus DSM 5350]